MNKNAWVATLTNNSCPVNAGPTMAANAKRICICLQQKRIKDGEEAQETKVVVAAREGKKLANLDAVPVGPTAYL